MHRHPPRARCRATGSGAVSEALARRLAKTVVGDPVERDGPHGARSPAWRSARRCAARVRELAAVGEIVAGSLDKVDVVGADPEKGAFLNPILLYCDAADAPCRGPRDRGVRPGQHADAVRHAEEAIELAKRGEGSLVGSVFTYDDGFAREMVLGTAAYHGRLLLANRDCAKESTGHGSPLPALVHGGPGRAGGGEEMGGMRGVLHFMQRTALAGLAATLTARHRPLDTGRGTARRPTSIRSASISRSSRSAMRCSPASAR